jgi:hypothetical protein
MPPVPALMLLRTTSFLVEVANVAVGLLVLWIMVLEYSHEASRVGGRSGLTSRPGRSPIAARPEPARDSAADAMSNNLHSITGAWSGDSLSLANAACSGRDRNRRLAACRM